jgi:hypothetical protein
MRPGSVSDTQRPLGIWLGILLAIANVFVISTGMGIAAGEAGVMLFVGAFSIVPAVLTGLVLGAMADVFATRRPLLRFTLLASFALAVLSGLASFFDLSELVPYSAVPTLLFVIVLEGMTRRRVVDPPIPPAVVH